MNTYNYRVQQLSPGDRPAIHRYYDVPVQEFQGTRILYFAFHSETIPGPGDVMVADYDGFNAHKIGESNDALGHTGGDQTWLGPSLVSYCSTRTPQVQAYVYDLEKQESHPIDGVIRSFHHKTGLAIMEYPNKGSRNMLRQQIKLWNMHNNKLDHLIQVSDIVPHHPLVDIFDPAQINLMNPKWHPAGTRFFVVFTTQIYAKQHNLPRKIKSLILADSTGKNIQYIGEFSHHPMWTPDGKHIVAHVQTETGQDLMLYSLTPDIKPQLLIEDFKGVHSSFNSTASQVVTDIFDYPEKGQASIGLYTVETGTLEILATGIHPDTDHTTGCHPHPQWSPNDKRIYFNMSDTGVPQLYALDIE